MIEFDQHLTLGMEVCAIEPGVGSFFNLWLRDTAYSGQQLEIWVYFADWYYFEGEVVLSTNSDLPDCPPFNGQSLVGRKLKYFGRPKDDPAVYVFSFTGNVGFQLAHYRWDADGDEELAMMFRDGHHVASLVPSDLSQ